MFDYFTTSDFIEISGQRIPITNLQLNGTCYSEKKETLFGTARAKIVKFDMDTSVLAEGTSFMLHCETADETGDGQDNTIGTFIVKSAPVQDTSGLIHVTAFDVMHKANIVFESELGYDSGTVTLLDVLNEACSISGVVLRSGQNLANANFIVDVNRFESWQTCRNVFRAVAGATGSFATIVDDELVFITPDIDATAVAEVDTEQYSTLDYQLPTSPINTVTFKNSLSGDAYTLSNAGNDPVCEAVIWDIPFAYNNDKAQALLPAILDKLSGFTYVPFAAEGLGDPSLNLGDPLIIDDKNGNRYPTFAFTMVYRSTQDDKKNSTLSAPAKSQSSVSYDPPMSKAEKMAQQAYQLSQTFAEAIAAVTEAISNPGTSFVKFKKTVSGNLTDCSPTDGPEEIWLTSKAVVDSSTNIVRFNSAGLGLSKDGGVHYTQAMTGSGILASSIIFDIALGAKAVIGNPTGQRCEIYSTSGAPFIDFYDPTNILRARWNYDGLKFTDATGTIITTLATTTADKTITVGAGKMFSTIQAAIDSIPMFNIHNTLIDPDAGTYNETTTLKNKLGNGKIMLNPFNRNITVNNIVIQNTQCEVDISKITQNPASQNSFITLINTRIIAIDSSPTLANSPIGISATDAGKVVVTNNTISNKTLEAIWSNGDTKVILINNTGSGNSAGLYASNGGIIVYDALTIAATTPVLNSGGIIIPSIGFRVTDWLTWDAETNMTGFSTKPAGGIYRYRYIGNEIEIEIRQPNDGISNSNAFTIPLPVAAATITNMIWYGLGVARDNAVTLSMPCDLQINSGASVITLNKDASAATWTASGGKRLARGSIKYQPAS